MDIPHEKRFHFRDDASVGSLEELKEKLEGISYPEFYHHVNDEKNDFAEWVRHVLEDEELADNLGKVTSIVETVEIIEDHLRPKPVEDVSETVQTKIEDEIGVHVPVEDVPTTAPETAVHTGETTEMEVAHEESGAEHDPEDTTDTEHGEHVLSQHDYTRLIVKDFMYGLIFGLIIGLILGRILSF